MAPVDLGDLIEQALQANEGYCSEFGVAFDFANEAGGREGSRRSRPADAGDVQPAVQCRQVLARRRDISAFC